ncbi:MAG: VCBS repeat-containing protein [Saprospiraceae bacterium]|nr:VCBS repeat-containing protein [Saprospiraceae bacterium]
MKVIETRNFRSPISDIQNPTALDSNKYLLLIGEMNPNERQEGQLVAQFNRNKTESYSDVLLDSLKRPVNINVEDINHDGVKDFLVCHYGNLMGKLSWFDGKNFNENILKPVPGARNTIIKDMNGDDLLDIIALFCQARESISIFYNQGNGLFQEEIIQEFPPVYGSSYIDVADMNNDGKPDILYTNGDNADYSIVLKPYHGLRIFLNNGSNHFNQAYFSQYTGLQKF